MKHLKSTHLLRLFSLLVAFLVWVIGKTVRFTVINKHYYEEACRKFPNVIYALWHNRIFLIAYTHRKKNVHVLVSSSRDGEFLSRMVKRLGFEPVRGSSSRQGSQALLRLLKRMEEGYDAAITPDGPRGPVYDVKPGIIHLARKSGRVIVPVTYNTNRRVVINSWDRFIIPYPFTRAVFIYGRPIIVSSEADEQLIEREKTQLQKVLGEITTQADEFFKRDETNT